MNNAALSRQLLLVEDDDLLAEQTARALSRHGAQVLSLIHI